MKHLTLTYITLYLIILTHHHSRINPISTSKPGIDNYYIKDVYKDISNYNNRKIKYFEDKTRWNSVYDKDILKNISEEEYKKRQKLNLGLCEYEYSHDENLKNIVTAGKVKKDENAIREKL